MPLPLPLRPWGLAVLLGLGACAADPGPPTRPAPLATKPPAATGTVVVQPQQ